MSSIIGPHSNNEVVNTLGDLAFERKRRIAKLPLAPLVQRMAELDPPPKGLQTGKAGRPAISMTAAIVVPTARSTLPCTALRVEQAIIRDCNQDTGTSPERIAR